MCLSTVMQLSPQIDSNPLNRHDMVSVTQLKCMCLRDRVCWLYMSLVILLHKSPLRGSCLPAVKQSTANRLTGLCRMEKTHQMIAIDMRSHHRGQCVYTIMAVCDRQRAMGLHCSVARAAEYILKPDVQPTTCQSWLRSDWTLLCGSFNRQMSCGTNCGHAL